MRKRSAANASRISRARSGFTPVEIANHAANKYLGVLVAAKYARALNEFPGGSASRDKKLTTRSLEELAKGDIDYRVVPRRRSAE